MSTKTPVTILQELSVKRGACPQYDYLEKQNNLFQCKVSVLNVEAIGSGRCKKDSKQESARLLLKKLAELGKYFPSSCDNLTVPSAAPEDQDALVLSASLLADFCNNFHLPPPVYTLLQDTGPAHAKHFTMECKVGGVHRVATALTKKLAKHQSANKLLDYFKENMGDALAEFVQTQDAMRNNPLEDEAIDKYFELSETWRPNLGYIVAKYHYGFNEIEKELVKKAREYLSLVENESETSKTNLLILENALDILKLEHRWESVENNNKNIMMLLKIPHSIPPLYMDGSSHDEHTAKIVCAHKALKYLKQMLFFTL